MRLYVSHRGRTGVSFGCLGLLFAAFAYVLLAALAVAAVAAVLAVAGIGAAGDWLLRSTVPRYRQRRIRRPLHWPGGLIDLLGHMWPQ